MNDPCKHLNDALDDMWLASFRGGAAAVEHPVDDIRACNDTNSAAEQERYEGNLIEQARAIVDGAHAGPPTVEHLRVLLDWLDGAQPHASALDTAPF
jgi:hypothetical protein